jgi:predicted dehydrogenase
MKAGSGHAQQADGRLIGVALLGCGALGAKRIASLPATMRLRSVYDLDAARARVMADAYAGEVHVAASPDDALAQDVDLAIVSTYHRSLPTLALAAVEAGCHVLVEKPGARTAAELGPLHDAAAAQNRVVRVGYNHRFHPALMRAKELVASGQYGEMISVRARYGHGGRPGYGGEWRTDPELSGGGELLDQGVHLIDLTRYLIGDVDLTFAEVRTDFWDCSVEDNAYLALRPFSGGFVWLHASWTEWKNLFSFEIALRTAKIAIAGLGGSYGTERLTLYEMLPEMGPPRTTSWEWPFPDSSWELELADVVTAMQGGTTSGAGIDDALAVLDIVENAYAYAPIARRRAPVDSRA